MSVHEGHAIAQPREKVPSSKRSRGGGRAGAHRTGAGDYADTMFSLTPAFRPVVLPTIGHEPF